MSTDNLLPKCGPNCGLPRDHYGPHSNQSDSPIKSWIEERRAIHAGGRDVLLRSSYELERESGIEEGNDIDAIVDAHNMFPRALSAIEAVLELHVRDSITPDFCEECSDFGTDNEPVMSMVRYPCATRRALEGVIDGE